MTPAQPAGGAAVRFDVLDALRGICALLVALYHFQSSGYLSSLAIVQNGWLFVDYFFVLSGFVIAHSYGERLANREVSVGRFMGLRMGRIYPLHVAVLLGFVALELALIGFGESLSRYVSREAFSGTRNPDSLFQSVFLLQSFGFGEARGWNIPAWSIAAEIWTYFLFAFIFLAPKRYMLAIAGLLAISTLLWMSSYSANLHITFEGGILRCIYGFAIGVLTYHVFRRFGGVGSTLWELAVLGVTLAFVSFTNDALTFAAPLVFACMVFVLASQRGAVSSVLAAKPFQLLGLTSYSIYMIHMFVQGRVGEVLQITKVVDLKVDDMGRTVIEGPPIVSDMITLAMLAVVIAGAFVTYYIVEKPGRDISRRLFGDEATARTGLRWWAAIGWMLFMIVIIFNNRPWEHGWTNIALGLGAGLAIWGLSHLSDRVGQRLDIGEARFDSETGQLVKKDES